MAKNAGAPQFGGLHEKEGGGNRGGRKVNERTQMLPDVQ